MVAQRWEARVEQVEPVGGHLSQKCSFAWYALKGCQYLLLTVVVERYRKLLSREVALYKPQNGGRSGTQ